MNGGPGKPPSQALRALWIWVDQRRIRGINTEKLMQERPDTRIVIVGDATMAPEELVSPFGSITGFDLQDARASIHWLERIAGRYKHTVWLNPIPRERWGGNGARATKWW